VSGSAARGEVPPTTLDLLGALEDLIVEGRRVPFTSTVAINDADVLGLIERIRASLPSEMVRAHELLDRREEVLTATTADAEQIRARAEEAARNLTDRAEATARQTAEQIADDSARLREQAQAEATRLLEGARARAEEMVAEHTVVRLAEERAAARVREAEAHAGDVVARAEGYMEEAEDYVRETLADLEQRLAEMTKMVGNGLKTLKGRHGAQPPVSRRTKPH
jgi:cell division septum initiation protein DivIVA